MYKNKLMLSTLLAIFCFLIAINSVAAIDNSTFNDELAVTDNLTSQNQLNSINPDSNLNEQPLEKNSDENLTKSEDKEDELSIIKDYERLEKSDESNLTTADNTSDEIISMPVNSTADVLSSVSVSSSQGHIFHKGGYTFKVSANQYKKIRQAINIGKKRQFLDWGFEFKVKTNKIHKYKKPIYANKKVTAYKWIYKRVEVSQETFWNWEWRFYADKTKTKNGWICYKLSETDYEDGIPYTHYVHFKKKVKYRTTKKVRTGKYKPVNMRIYANIKYVGSQDYITGEHAYFPWVSFEAMRSGYKTIYLNGLLLM